MTKPSVVKEEYRCDVHNFTLKSYVKMSETKCRKVFCPHCLDEFFEQHVKPLEPTR